VRERSPGVEVPDIVTRTETRYNSGFQSARDFNFNLSANTNIYGVFVVKKAKNGLAFRHTVQPSLSYSYQPDFGTDFWGYYRNTLVDIYGTTQRVSRFNGLIFGGPGQGEQQTLTFDLNNVFETKFLPKTARGDTVSKKDYKKVTLLDNFGARMAYNFAADSLNLSDLSLTARSNVLGRVNLNFGASFSPYAIYAEPETPERQRVVNQWASGAGQGLLRFTNATFALSTSLKSRSQVADQRTPNPNRPDSLKTVSEERKAWRELYQTAVLPWTLNVGYSANYTRPNLDPGVLNHSLNLQASLQLTANWSLRATTNFDLKTQQFSVTQINIVRDLHCWEFSFQWVPFGTFKSYLFNIGVKNATLKDLKMTKQNRYQDRFGGQ
jgi:hypothetical protein